MFGQSIDAAAGKELDRQAAVFGVKRDQAMLFGLALPWGQRDETLRRRIFWSYQTDAAPKPCVHNVWIGYDTGTKCGDCNEWLCWLPAREVKRMQLFTTKGAAP